MTMPNAMLEASHAHAYPAEPSAHARVLASSLAHLLARDEGCPALWHTPDFASAVEAGRRELRFFHGTPRATTPALDPGCGIGFDEAVARLARNPIDVAAALLHLELDRREPLPAWRELVRRGLPARTADVDIALWFG